jgi:hypothetical protein
MLVDACSQRSFDLLLWRMFCKSSYDLRVRPAERDRARDRQTVGSIATVLERAENDAEAERAGLDARLTDLISRAALAGRNDLADSLTRAASCARMLRESDTEIRRGQMRIATLESRIAQFRLLRGELAPILLVELLKPQETGKKRLYVR